MKINTYNSVGAFREKAGETPDQQQQQRHIGHHQAADEPARRPAPVRYDEAQHGGRREPAQRHGHRRIHQVAGIGFGGHGIERGEKQHDGKLYPGGQPFAGILLLRYRSVDARRHAVVQRDGAGHLGQPTPNRTAVIYVLYGTIHLLQVSLWPDSRGKSNNLCASGGLERLTGRGATRHGVPWATYV
jgi:hypothetical protein